MRLKLQGSVDPFVQATLAGHKAILTVAFCTTKHGDEFTRTSHSGCYAYQIAAAFY